MATFGWRLAIACVILIGCATARTETVKRPPTVDVTGTWSGTWLAVTGNIPLTMTLRQANADVTGDAVINGDGWQTAGYSGAIQGTVSGDAFSFSYPGSSVDMTVSANEMRGVSSSGKPIQLRRQ